MNEHPTPAPPARGDATRIALIDAAIEVFGRDGFDAASTRTIAGAAGVNQALIGYHFGGKSGLYLAALRHIAETLAARIGPLLGAIEAELERDRHDDSEGEPRPRSARENRRGHSARHEADDGAAHCLAQLHRLTDAFVVVLTSDESGPWARLILREQQDPTEGFDVLYANVMQRVFRVISRLVGRIGGIDPSSTQAALLAVTIIGQVLAFRAARAAVMRHLGWGELGGAEIAAIQDRIRRNITAIVARETFA
ncbi:MAG: CerR family C-terminal domain-containing protein [Gammaproteobacteria bacterium]|nr:CerR family C-terminal domain-containing protein [Gammaproteobacteria bacterium]